jgi:hypothetical protein
MSLNLYRYNTIEIRCFLLIILSAFIQKGHSQKAKSDSFIICNKKIPLTSNCVYEVQNNNPRNYYITYKDRKVFQVIHWFEIKSKKELPSAYKGYIEHTINSHPNNYTKEEFDCLFLGKVIKGFKFHIGASYRNSTYQIILPISIDNCPIIFIIYSKNNLKSNDDFPYPFNQLIQFQK